MNARGRATIATFLVAAARGCGGCTLVRKRGTRVEVVLPLRSCIEADNVTFFRSFTWDFVGGERAAWPYVGSPYPPGAYDVSTWAAVAR